MKKVSIYYTPYLDSAKLMVDGVERKAKGKRIDAFVAGQPIKSWLSPYVYSYRRWDGILAELIEDLNDDEIELSFYSLPEYFSMVREELKKQSTAIEEKGYDSGVWTFKGVAYYLPETICKNITAFIQAEKHFLPGQHSMILMEYAEKELLEEQPPSVSRLIDILGKLKAVIKEKKKECRSKKNDAILSHWKKTERALYAVYGGRLNGED